MRLVLVDNRVQDHKGIIDSLTEDTEYLNFEFQCDIESIKEKITKTYESVAIIQHNYDYEVYRLVIDFSNSILDDLETVDPALNSWQEYIDFLLWLKNERGTNYIDLLACNLWANPNWRYMIETVRSVYDIYIRASVDITGEDGDFILESDNFDTIGVYFTENILNYKYNFYYFPFSGAPGYNNYLPYTLPSNNLGKVSSRYANLLGTYSPNTYTDVVNVVSNGGATAILRANGNVVLIGDPKYGGTMPCGIVTQSNLVNVKKIVSSYNCFCALKNDGTIVCWGFVTPGQTNTDINTYQTTISVNGTNGMIINVNAVRSQLVNVADIFSNRYDTFAALKTNGSVVTWGFNIRGGDQKTASTFLSSGILKIFVGTDSFCALKNDGTAVIWGGYGVEAPIFSTTYFNNSTPILDAIICTTGGSIALYIRQNGNTKDIVLSYSSTIRYTFPQGVNVLKKLSYSRNYGVHFFIHLSNNMVISIQNYNQYITYSNVTDIQLSDSAIALIQNGSVVVSGSANSGGSLTDATYGLKSGSNLNNPARLVSSSRSFGVIKSDNTFVWWGVITSPYIGEYVSKTFPTNATETVLYNATSSNIKSIYSSQDGHVIVKQDNTIATLGTGGSDWLYNGNGYGKKTTNYAVKDASTNVFFDVTFAGYISIEIPYSPLLTPTSIDLSVPTSVSYYVSNPDNIAHIGRKYGLYNGATLIDTFIPTRDTHTYVFSNVNISSVVTYNLTLDIVDYSTIAYTVTSFQLQVNQPSVGSNPIITTVTPATNQLIVGFSQSSVGSPAPTYYYSFNGVDPCGNGVSTSPITIPNLTQVQSYKFYIIATNAAGSVISDFSYGTPYVKGSAPAITNVTPQNNSLVVSFTQSSVGNPTPTYYYSFNGVDLSVQSVSASPITIPNLTQSQYYTFYIIAANTAGNAVSDASSGKPLVIGSKPAINAVDASLNSLVVSFTQSNVGNPSPTYYYSFNGVDPLGQGVSASPIKIPNLTQVQSYTFYIISSNSIGNIVSDLSSGTPLVIGSKPAINTVDASLNSLIVSFTQSSVGNPAPTYYYSFNGVDPLGQGVSASPIKIPNLTQAQNYTFYIIATSTAGNTVSDSSLGKPLIIGGKPAINNVDASLNSLIVSFTQSNVGNPSPTYYYSFNGVEPSGQGVSASPIKIPNLTQAQNYTFYIIATSTAGNTVSDSSLGTPLVVGSKPSINNVTPDVNKLIVNFSDASGFNPVHSTYYSLNGGVTYPYLLPPNSTSFNIENLTTATIYYISLKSSNNVGFQISNTVSGEPLVVGSAPHINSVTTENNKLTVNFTDAYGFNPMHTTYYSIDGGNTYPYQVLTNPFDIIVNISKVYYISLKSANNVGFQISNTVSGEVIGVGSPPSIVSVTPATNSLIVSFTQSSTGYPLPTYYYSFNGVDLSGQGVSASPITIPNLKIAQDYTFYIIASSSAGNISSSASSGKPNVIGTAPIINAITPGMNSISVAFNGSIGSNPSPTYYYSFDGVAKLGSGTSASPITIPNLNEAKYYKFYLIASNSAGNAVSDPSYGKPFAIGTPPAITKITPQLNSLSAEFTQSDVGNPAAVYYYSFDGITTVGNFVYGSPITIMDLSMAQVYKFYIIASNTIGNVVSDPSYGRPYYLGSKPVIISVTPQENSLSVGFSSSTGGNPPAAKYYYSFDGVTPVGNWVFSSPISIPNLLEAKDYTFYIIASNAAGNIVSDVSSGKPLIFGTSPYINSVTPVLNGLTVSYIDSSGGNPTPLTYYSIDRGATYPYLVPTKQSFTISFSSPNVYYISLKSTNSLGSLYSNTVSGEPFFVGTAPVINSVSPALNKLIVTYTDGSGYSPVQTTYYSLDGGLTFPYVVTDKTFAISGLTSTKVYYIQLMSSNRGGSQLSNIVSNTPLGIGIAPVINSVVADVNNLTVSFTDASGFNPAHKTYYSMDGGATYPYLVPSNTQFVINNLTTATIYYIRLKSINSAGSLVSNTVSGEPFVIGTAPILNTPVPNTNSLTISFTAASGFNPAPTTYYSIDGGATYPSVVPSNPFTLTGLSNRVYYVKLRSTNVAGNLTSNTVTGEPYYIGNAPVLNTPVPGKNTLTFSFTDATGFNPAPTTYYSIDGGATYPSVVPSNPFTLTGLSNRVYYVKLRSINAAGNLVSSTVSGEPYYIGSAPVLNTPVSSKNSLTISFTDATGFNPAPTTYYSLDGGATYPSVVPSNPFTLSNLLNRVYYIKLQSINVAGNLVSNAVSGEPYYIGTAPVLNTLDPNTNGLTISFTDATGFNPAPTTYYSIDGGLTYPSVVPSNPFTLSNLLNRVYYIKLRSTNSVGNLTSSTVSGEPYYIGTAPVLNTLYPDTNSLIISFTDASGFNPAPKTYYSLDGGATYPYLISKNPFTVNNLSNLVYYIKLQSTNVAGSLVSSTLSGEPYYVGTAPVLNTPIPGKNTLTISFTDAFGFNPKHTTYYSLDGGASFPYLVPPENPFTINDLSGIPYYVRIGAFNSAGSKLSNTISATPYTVGTAPVLNSLTPGNSSLRFSFTEPVGFNPQQKTYYSLDGGATFPYLVTSNPYTITDLLGTIYYVTLKSVNEVGFEISNTLSATPYSIGTAPVLNSLTPGLNSLTVSFTDGSGYNPIQKTYYSLNGGSTYPYLVTSNPFTINELSNALYYIRLKSSNDGGFQVSNILSANPFSVGNAPVLNPLEPSTNSLTISFTDATDFNPAPTTYYSLDGGATYPYLVPSNRFTLSDLSGRVYYISLKSSNSYGFQISNMVSGEPYYTGTNPIINSVTPGKNKLIVDFSGSTEANPTPSYYYSIDGGLTYDPSAVNSPTFTINDLNTAEVYYIAIKAVNPAGTKVSNIFTGKPWVIGTTPIIDKVTPGVNSLSVTFYESIGGNPEPKYYYSLNGTDLSGTGVYYSQGVSITIPNLTISKFYDVYIIASNLAGNIASPVARGKPLVIGNAPTINTITPGPNNLTVGFVQTNPGNPAPQYYYSFNGTDICGNSTSSSPIVIPNLTVAKYYTFYIISSNSIGNISSLSASGEPWVIGTAPVLLDASSILNGLVIRFTESVGGNPLPDTYYYSLNGGEYVDSGFTSSPLTISGLDQPSQYSVVLKAHNAMGNTSASNAVFGIPYIIGTPPIIYDVSSGINSMTVSFTGSTFGYPPPIAYYYSIDGVNYIDAETTASSFVINELTKYGPYDVTLIAYSLAGYTEPSIPVVGRAYVIGDAPIIIRDLVNFNEVVLDFSNNGSYPFPTEYYYSLDGVNYTVSSQTDATPLKISDLTSNTPYNISLYALNLVGPSPIVTISIITLSGFGFFAETMNPSYNRNAPIYIGPQPKNNPSLNGGTNITAVGTRAKFSRYVSGTAGSRR